VTSGSNAVGPLLQVTRSVPIVFVAVPDPVSAGFVDSVARPGRPYRYCGDASSSRCSAAWRRGRLRRARSSRRCRWWVSSTAHRPDHSRTGWRRSGAALASKASSRGALSRSKSAGRRAVTTGCRRWPPSWSAVQ
jgi:hypothetical protein